MTISDTDVAARAPLARSPEMPRVVVKPTVRIPTPEPPAPALPPVIHLPFVPPPAPERLTAPFEQTTILSEPALPPATAEPSADTDTLESVAETPPLSSPAPSKTRPIGRRDVEAAFRKASAVTRRVRHEVAYYFDVKGNLAELHYTILRTDSGFSWARRHDLFADKAATQPLQVRNGKSRDDGTEYGIPHFWAPRSVAPEQPTNYKLDPEKEPKEKDPRHEARVDYLVKCLNNMAPRQMLTYDFDAFNRKVRKGEIPKDTDPRTLVDVDHFKLADVRGYTWWHNPRKFEMSNGHVIPDLYGWDQKAKTMTEARPAIFVEVVNTSYPSEEKWQAYREATATRNLIVVFDFLENYHFQPRRAEPKMKRSEADIRAIYYMWKGGVWRNTRRLDAPRPNDRNALEATDAGYAPYPVRAFQTCFDKDERWRARGSKAREG